MLGTECVYFIEYEYMGNKSHCQIEARTESEAKDILLRRFDYCCRITKIQTNEDIAEEVSNKLIGMIISQMDCSCV